MEEWNDHLVGNVERYGDVPWTITIRLCYEQLTWTGKGIPRYI